jgi:hypothetical protein
VVVDNVRREFSCATILLSGVLTLTGCAYTEKEKAPPPQWSTIEDEHCVVDLRKETANQQAKSVTVGLTEQGDTAICLAEKSTKMPQLVALTNENQCISKTGIEKANKNFSSHVVRIASPDGAALKPIPAGSKAVCADTGKLAGGGTLTVYGPKKGADKEPHPTVAIAVQNRLLAKLAPDRMWTQAPPPDLPPDILATMSIGGVVDAYCELQDWHQNAMYGVLRRDGVDDPGTFLVCDPDAAAEESLICEVIIPSEPGFRIGIVGNDRDNHITGSTEPTACGAGSTLAVSPPNQLWNLDQLWIVGWGGSDRLSGINDADTWNVIWGDYGCSLESPGYEYIGSGGTDYIWGGPGADALYGEEGSDYIWGRSGKDRIVGFYDCDVGHVFDDQDHIWGGPGDDTIHGDAPSYRVRIDHYLSRDRIYGGTGNDIILGGPGHDKIHGDTEFAVDEGGEDEICGNEGSDAIFPGPYCDHVYADRWDQVRGVEPCDDIELVECPIEY